MGPCVQGQWGARAAREATRAAQGRWTHAHAGTGEEAGVHDSGQDPHAVQVPLRVVERQGNPRACPCGVRIGHASAHRAPVHAAQRFHSAAAREARPRTEACASPAVAWAQLPAHPQGRQKSGGGDMLVR